MRCEFGDADFLGELLHHVPYNLLAYAIPPRFPRCAHAPEQFPGLNTRRPEPYIQLSTDPIGHGDGSNVAALAYQIHDGPALLALLKMFER